MESKTPRPARYHEAQTLTEKVAEWRARHEAARERADQ